MTRGHTFAQDYNACLLTIIISPILQWVSQRRGDELLNVFKRAQDIEWPRMHSSLIGLMPVFR